MAEFRACLTLARSLLSRGLGGVSDFRQDQFFFGVKNMNTSFKGALLSLGLMLGFGLAAHAAPTNYHACLEVPGEGFGGLACTVAGNDEFDFGGGDVYVIHNSGNDHEPDVEAALRWVFGAEVPLTGIHDIKEDDGFEITFLNDYTVEIELSQEWTFATLKAATYFIIFDVRGLDKVTLSTEGYIHNDRGAKAPIEISHLSFWLAGSGDDDGPGPNQVPVPGALSLMGMGLLGLGAMRRRRSSRA